MGEKILLKPVQEEHSLIKDGKTFRLVKVTFRGEHTTGLVYEEVDEKDWQERRNKLAEYLVDMSGLEAKTIIEDALKQLPLNYLKRLEKKMKKKEPVVVEKGCIGLKLGRLSVPIRD